MELCYDGHDLYIPDHCMIYESKAFLKLYFQSAELWLAKKPLHVDLTYSPPKPQHRALPFILQHLNGIIVSPLSMELKEGFRLYHE